MKGIIMDLDDTLYYELDYVKSGFREVSKYIAGKYHIDYNVFLNILLTILDEKGRGTVFDTALENFELPINEVTQMVEIYRNHKPRRIKIYKDVEDALRRWSGRYRLGIITDGNSIVQWNKIDVLGLKDKVDEIIVTDDHGVERRKPAPFAYKRIVERFKINFSEAVYIGDNPDKDFITAGRLGMRTIRIVRTQGMHINKRLDESYEAKYEINSFDELDQYL